MPKFTIEIDGFTRLRASIALPRRLGSQVSRNTVDQVCKILADARKALEAAVHGDVHVAYDSYESALFWYIVFFRPIVLRTSDPTLGTRDWTVFSLINEGRVKALNMSNAGVVVDETSGWLVLKWKEAREEGILSNLDDTPAWRSLVSRTLGRSYEMLGEQQREELLKLLAMGSSFFVPLSTVYATGFIKKRLWWLEKGEGRDNLVVFDLKGIESVRVGLRDSAIAEGIPETIQRFKYFYVDNAEEYKHVMGEARKAKEREYRDKHSWDNYQRTKRWREQKKDTLEGNRAAGELVTEMWRILNSGKDTLEHERRRTTKKRWWGADELRETLRLLGHKLKSGILPVYDHRSHAKIQRDAEKLEDMLGAGRIVGDNLVKAFGLWARLGSVPPKKDGMREFGEEIVRWIEDRG